MIKVNIKTKENKELDFPKLMISAEGSIVYMESYNIGVRLEDGMQSDNWFMSRFKDFYGSVTLTQE